MAGYNGYSKSNNAIIAEKDGKFPLSIAAKKIAKELKLKEKDVKESIRNYHCEWHHTSCHYNVTYYYDVQDIIERIKNGSIIVKEIKEEKINAKYFADVEFLEWTGTRTRPKATTIKLSNIEVTDKGSYVTFEYKGNIVKKFKKTKGFTIRKIFK